LFRSSPVRVLFPVLLLANPVLAAEPPLRAAVVVVAQAPSLEVRIDLENSGGQDVRPLTVTGELRGDEESVELRDGLKKGARADARLRFPAAPAGSYGLALRLLHPSLPGGPDTVEQLQCVSLDLGDGKPSLVDVRAGDVSLETTGEWPLTLASRDGKAHHVRLWLEVPRGLGVSTLAAEADTDGRTPTLLRPRLYRGAIPRGARVGAYVVAESDGPSASLGQATIEILPDPALLPKLRLPLAILAGVLLLAAAGSELRARLP
jgi:hypothetical protein